MLANTQKEHHKQLNIVLPKHNNTQQGQDCNEEGFRPCSPKLGAFEGNNRHLNRERKDSENPTRAPTKFKMDSEMIFVESCTEYKVSREDSVTSETDPLDCSQTGRKSTHCTSVNKERGSSSRTALRKAIKGCPISDSSDSGTDTVRPGHGRKYREPFVVPKIIVSKLDIRDDEKDNADKNGEGSVEEDDPNHLSPSTPLSSWTDLYQVLHREAPIYRHQHNSMPDVFIMPRPVSTPPSILPPPGSVACHPLPPRVTELLPASSSLPKTPPTLDSGHGDLSVNSTQRSRDQISRSNSPLLSAQRPRSPAGSEQLLGQTRRSLNSSSESCSATSVYELAGPQGDMSARSNTMLKLVHSLGPENFKTLCYKQLNSLKMSQNELPNSGSALKRPGKQALGRKKHVAFADCPKPDGIQNDRLMTFSLLMSPEGRAAMEQASHESNFSNASSESSDLQKVDNNYI